MNVLKLTDAEVYTIRHAIERLDAYDENELDEQVVDSLGMKIFRLIERIEDDNA